MGVSDPCYFFLHAVVTPDVLTVSNNDAKLLKTQTIHLAKADCCIA